MIPIPLKGRLCLVLALAGLLAGCTSAAPTAPLQPDATPAEAARVLHVFNWDAYMDPGVIARFEQENGVTVQYDTYETNEAMLAAVQAAPAAYDVIIPTDYMVAAMRQAGLLAPLDKAHIPNAKNVDPAFANPVYDPGSRYCLPYQWGTVGIGYNSRTLPGGIESWAEVFDPSYAGRISMMADVRLSLGAVLLYLGHSPNTTNEAEIDEARNFLMSHAAQIAAYAPDTGQDLLAGGEVDMALEWSGDIFSLMAENSDIRYVIPQEGSIVWTDSLCIPANAPHKALAEEFINYVLEPEVGAAISNYTHYASPNQAARPFLDPADRDNPALYPTASVQKRLFFLADLGAEAGRLYDAAWTEILAAHNGAR